MACTLGHFELNTRVPVIGMSDDASHILGIRDYETIVNEPAVIQYTFKPQQVIIELVEHDVC